MEYAVTIRVSEKDFELLHTNSMRWGPSWERHEGRFERLASEKYDTSPKWTWKMAYWFADRWSDVMLARAFLDSCGAEHDIVWDTADEVQEYVILTDFETKGWQDMKAKVHLIEMNSDLVYAQLGDGPIWFFGPVTPDMYGKFSETAKAWASGEWEPSENDGQQVAEWAEGMSTAAVLDTASMEVFYPGGPQHLDVSALLWLFGLEDDTDAGPGAGV